MLQIDTDGAVCRLTLDRPEKLNALTEELREALHAEVRRLAADPAVRVVVLAGAGRAFSAGYDFTAAPSPASDGLVRRQAANAWARLLDDFEALPQVTVAALQSHVVGGAALLALACDLRVAAPDLRLAIPELSLGIPLTWGGIPRLVREVGLSRARDLVMTGRPVDAAEGLHSGLVHRLAADRPLADEVAALVAGLVETPAVPLAATKAAFRAVGSAAAGTHLAWADADLLAQSLRPPNPPEG